MLLLLLLLQAELREEIVAKETSNSESLACIEECLRKKFDQDVEWYKDQICRLEATIAAHQEKLGRILKASRRANKPCQQQQQGICIDCIVYIFYTIITQVCILGQAHSVSEVARS